MRGYLVERQVDGMVLGPRGRCLGASGFTVSDFTVWVGGIQS